MGSAKQAMMQEYEARGQVVLFGGALECQGKGREVVLLV